MEAQEEKNIYISSPKTYIFNINILSEQIRKRIRSFKEYRTSEEFSKRKKICEVFDYKISFDLQPHMKRICTLIHYMYIIFSPCFRTLTYHLHLRIAFPWNIIWPLQFCSTCSETLALCPVNPLVGALALLILVLSI